MRVVEPRHFSNLKPKKVKSKRKVYALVLLPFLLVGLWYGWQHPPKIRLNNSKQPANSAQSLTPTDESNKPKTIKTFTGNDFKVLFQSLAHPNTQPFSEPPEITGNAAADARIRQLAEARGYRLSSIPVTALVRTDEATRNNDDLLQPLAYESWVKLKAAAQAEGIPIVLYSGYRSPEFQRGLFLERLYARNVTAEMIANGRADAAIQATLIVTAVPGYSRHHGGYTADFRCEDGSGEFAASICFRWLNENNYARAKQHGWIPSYPQEADLQGPEPEPWEYVWVGIEALSE
jgi:LAS superfamily LD-carboxypeptidase LdcB